VLHAIGLVIPGAPFKCAKSDFYDTSKEIRIQLDLIDVTKDDYARIPDEEARTRLQSSEVSGAIAFVRIFNLDGDKVTTPQLHVIDRVATEPRFTPSGVKDAVTGAGAELRTNVVAVYPELETVLGAKPVQSLVKKEIQKLIDTLKPDDFDSVPVPLKSGLDTSVKAFLPEVIYIQAVKDVADDIKTTDSATFGKLLGILLDTVRPKFADMEKEFEKIQKKMSRILNDEGEIEDGRDAEFQHIESVINGFVAESFPDTSLQLRVPAPELKTIFNNAELSVNDGHESSVVSKGDGLKRSVAFAILRTYMKLKTEGFPISADAPADDVVPATAGTYLLMYEEPELYLHPRAQRQLFQALQTFAGEHHVLVTTHSPLFLDPFQTKSFTKLMKEPGINGRSPVAITLPIDLTAVSERDAFQLICHENNEIAFFSRTVVLVEGDSDSIVLPHLARLINPSWDAMASGVSFARIGGKSNITRYRKFFTQFGVKVHVIADRDSLCRGFDGLDPNTAATAAQRMMLEKIDTATAALPPIAYSAERLKKIQTTGDIKQIWAATEELYQAWDGSSGGLVDITEGLRSFFAATKNRERAQIMSAGDITIDALRDKVISELNKNNTHVLARGDLESYYPNSGGSAIEKIKAAIGFCDYCSDISAYRSSSVQDPDNALLELTTILQSVFVS
jgi:putative ATP-dependent endonuclease of the OLD family